jgi:hypothetical protein
MNFFEKMKLIIHLHRALASYTDVESVVVVVAAVGCGIEVEVSEGEFLVHF